MTPGVGVGWVKRSADPTHSWAPRPTALGLRYRSTQATKTATFFLLVLAIALLATAVRADPVVTFTADERAAILLHGPWPQPMPPDPSNRVSGKPEAVALGRRLFFDKRLSADGQRSCATCH